VSSSETSERPKRLSLSSILELVLAKHAGPGASSITLGRTPKGDVVYEVVGRLADGQTLDELEVEVAAVVDRLAAKYPRETADESRASVDLTRNAKGETQIDVSLAGPDLESALAGAAKAYDSARSKYPLASGLVGAEPKAGEK
jgi:hypothetical protein